MANCSAISGGTLFIVATPIGHRDDISYRAVDVLRQVDAILAEDTRHSKPLLLSLGIEKPLISFHAHNEHKRNDSIIKALEDGQSMALISDAGTPLISDPGFVLVNMARKKNIPVIPVPGACALVAALSASGVPCDCFTFYGFLPAKRLARQTKLKSCLNSEHTLVFYESTHRIMECVEDITAIFGESHEFVLAKELTKTFERFVRGTGNAIQAWLEKDAAHRKGEFVLILPAKPKEDDTQEEKIILACLLKELPLKQAVNIAFELTHINKNKLYDLALALQKDK